MTVYDLLMLRSDWVKLLNISVNKFSGSNSSSSSISSSCSRVVLVVVIVGAGGEGRGGREEAAVYL